MRQAELLMEGYNLKTLYYNKLWARRQISIVSGILTGQEASFQRGYRLLCKLGDLQMQE